jgi:hypothetical protein
MQTTVTIEARVLGRKARLFDGWSIPLAALILDPAVPLSLES